MRNGYEWDGTHEGAMQQPDPRGTCERCGEENRFLLEVRVRKLVGQGFTTEVCDDCADFIHCEQRSTR